MSLIQLGELLVQQLDEPAGRPGGASAGAAASESDIARQVGLLGLGAMAILVLTRLSGTIAQFYNPQRAFLQSLIVLGVAVCWLPQRTGARWKPSRPADPHRVRGRPGRIPGRPVHPVRCAASAVGRPPTWPTATTTTSSSICRHRRSPPLPGSAAWRRQAS